MFNTDTTSTNFLADNKTPSKPTGPNIFSTPKPEQKKNEGEDKPAGGGLF